MPGHGGMRRTADDVLTGFGLDQFGVVPLIALGIGIVGGLSLSGSI